MGLPSHLYNKDTTHLLVAKTLKPFTGLFCGIYASREPTYKDCIHIIDKVTELLGPEFYFSNWVDGNEMHVTTLWSKEQPKMIQPSQNPVQAIIVGADLFGKFQEALVLKLVSPGLDNDFAKWQRWGASWDYPDYQPHLTLTDTWPAEHMDLNYRTKCKDILQEYFVENPMKITLGPECLEDLK